MPFLLKNLYVKFLFLIINIKFIRIKNKFISFFLNDFLIISQINFIIYI